MPHINARMETVHQKPMFRKGFARRRCLVPATGFFEWQSRADGKQPYRFVRDDLEPFAMAGLWEFARVGGEGILSATIIVGEPNPLVGGVHDRMPVMLRPDSYEAWLDPSTPLEDARAMLQPHDAGPMRAIAVSGVVNSVKNDREECIAPIAEDAGVPLPTRQTL